MAIVSTFFTIAGLRTNVALCVSLAILVPTCKLSARMSDTRTFGAAVGMLLLTSGTLVLHSRGHGVLLLCDLTRSTGARKNPSACRRRASFCCLLHGLVCLPVDAARVGGLPYRVAVGRPIHGHRGTVFSVSQQGRSLNSTAEAQVPSIMEEG